MIHDEALLILQGISKRISGTLKVISVQIKSGRQIFDIGTDAARPSRSSYYAAEVKALKDAGYGREFRRWISAEVNGEIRRFRLYEWVHP